MQDIMHCTVLEVRNAQVLVETQRPESQLKGCMWLSDSDLPESLWAPGCQFELTFIHTVGSWGSCVMHIVPLRTKARHPGTDVILTTILTLVCTQFLIEVGITRHETQHGPWIALSWLLTALVVGGMRWLGDSSPMAIVPREGFSTEGPEGH
jgi:hypothetical protein